ncbi:hypothetical protein LTS10_006330 [Elasticomyces elasticus]|nr:hypothetical protein LTS10_006330 [Elasticomyces elasticus]
MVLVSTLDLTQTRSGATISIQHDTILCQAPESIQSSSALNMVGTNRVPTDPNATPGVGLKRTAQQAFKSPKQSMAQATMSDKGERTDAGDSPVPAPRRIIRLTHVNTVSIPMPGESGYNETLYILLCFSNAVKGYGGLEWSPARHYLNALSCALRHTPEEVNKVKGASKESYEALVSSLRSLKFPEKEVNIASWSRSHAEQGLALMYAAEPAKLQWAIAALDEFASLARNTA